MSRCIVVGLACALSVGQGAVKTSFAQSNPSDDYWRRDVTAVAIAPDGTSGTATDAFANVALGDAIKDCQRQSKAAIGCGYQSTFVRQGWSLVFRCGAGSLLVAENELADAERAALLQERNMRARFIPNMPPCVRTTTVDPYGTVVAPKIVFRQPVKTGIIE
jgi:hypothetical protein